jgi:PAS domain S-box-containing protein
MKPKKYKKIHVPDIYVEKWQKIVDLIAGLFNVPAVLIMRVHSSRLEVLVTSQTRGNPFKKKDMADLNTGLYCETVMANRSLLHVANALEDAEWKDNPDVKLNMISYLGLPLVWPDGSIFGTICVLDEKTRDYSRDYVNLLRQFKEIIESDFKIIVVREKEITKRKNIEKKLRASEEKYSRVFNESPNSISVSRLRDSRFLEVNEGFQRITGYTREEVIGKTSLELRLWKNPHDRQTMLNEMQKKGRVHAMEFDFVHKNGKVMTCLTSGEMLELDGETYLISITSDITERKKANIALRESENRYRALFENATDAIFLMQGDKFIACNPKTLEIFGASREQIINHTPFDVSPPTQPDGRDSIESAREKIDKAHKGIPQSFEWEHIKADGTSFYVEVHLNRLELSTGVHLLAIVRDITERKRMEENLKEKQTRELQVLRALPMAFYVAQPFGDYGGTRVSDQIDRISGFKPGEFMSDIHLWASRLHPEDKERTLAQFDMLLKEQDFITVEYRWQAKNGKYVWILDQAVLTRDENNQPKEIIGTWLDITERKQAEEKERQYQDQLMQADKMVALGTLVSGVAHEINNPNNAIMFNAPLLKEIFDEIIPMMDERYQQEGDFQLAGLPYSQLKESASELFNGIIRSSDRIKAIVADLKNFARPESYDLDQEVNINNVVQASLTLLQNMIKKSTNNFSVKYGKNIAPVTGNFQRLEQVVINLVQNACQALENKQQAIGVSVSYDKKNHQVRMKVEDEGVGIDPENIKFITDPFFTSKREQGGTGLGLSVSARIIRNHGGTLHIQSEPGKGSVFIVALPVGKPGSLL